MSLEMRWAGEEDLDRVAETRLYCYASGLSELQRFKDIIRVDRKAAVGDFLLAERNGQAVGTATSLSQKICMRGGVFDCQGVAWVGAIRSERRSGVGAALMKEILRKGQEREQVVSALMPFRASFYERFGYGSVERRCEWTVPMAVLPTGNCTGVRLMRRADWSSVMQCQHRMALAGQCDMRRALAEWEYFFAQNEDGFVFVDSRKWDEPVAGWMTVKTQSTARRVLAWVGDMAYDDLGTFRRLLHLLASLKDQYWGVVITTPIDFRFNWLLREVQIPHRPVSHPAAESRVYNRMQMRILNHAKLIGGLKLPESHRGEVVVGVREVEGHTSKFRLEIDSGRAEARATEASAEVECPDRVWAAIVCGDLPALVAVRLGLAEVTGDDRWRVLEAFSEGPLPFCRDYF